MNNDEIREQAKKRVKATLFVADALYEAIKASPNGISAGQLYAMIMGKVSFELFTDLIGILVEAGKITNDHHLLKAK